MPILHQSHGVSEGSIHLKFALGPNSNQPAIFLSIVCNIDGFEHLFSTCFVRVVHGRLILSA